MLYYVCSKQQDVIFSTTLQGANKMAKILELNGWYYVLNSKGKLVGALLNYEEALKFKAAAV